MPVADVLSVTKTVQDAADKLPVMTMKNLDKFLTFQSVEKMETFLKTFASVVHGNHVILLRIKRSLVLLYGGYSTVVWGKGLTPEKMSEDQFNRKRQLCQELIEIFTKIMPGRDQITGRVGIS
jgi:hypothetical protein